jgi:hypothetical protein
MLAAAGIHKVKCAPLVPKLPRKEELAREWKMK